MAMKYKPYPAYKDSGISWLGDVPAHWEVRRLKHNFRLLTQKTDRRENPVALENIQSWLGRFIPTETEFEGEGIAFERGDILFGKLRPYLAKVFLAETAGEAVGDFFVMRPTSDVNGRFALYQILNKDFISIVDGSTFGAKMPRVNWEFMSGMVLVMPTKDEQSAIATFLDRETTKIDTLIAKQEHLIELLQEKRTALISHAVTKGLNPDAPMKDSGVEWLGGIPTGWNVIPIRALARQGADSFIDGDWIEAPFITDDGVRLIQTGNIGTGYYKEQGFRYISDNTFRLLKCTEIEPGNILICRLAEPVGRACIAPDLGSRMITSVDVCILKTKDNIDARFIVYLMSSQPYLGFMESQCRGGTRDRVSRSFLGSVRVVLPNKQEQVLISDFLDRETTKIDTLIQKSRHAIDLLKERRTALISAAVTGKIDVRDGVNG